MIMILYDTYSPIKPSTKAITNNTDKALHKSVTLVFTLENIFHKGLRLQYKSIYIFVNYVQQQCSMT